VDDRVSIRGAGRLLIIAMAAANAQQRAIERKGSMIWAGGNRMSPTNQLLSEAPGANLETDALCRHDVRYKVVPIGVLPGKTASFLTIVRA
jgi:hypothetical protein